eukprot:184305-Alexandrium_andersonii.AAC.1
MFFCGLSPTHRTRPGVPTPEREDLAQERPEPRPVNHRGLEGTGGPALHYHARGPPDHAKIIDTGCANLNLH